MQTTGTQPAHFVLSAGDFLLQDKDEDKQHFSTNKHRKRHILLLILMTLLSLVQNLRSNIPEDMGKSEGYFPKNSHRISFLLFRILVNDKTSAYFTSWYDQSSTKCNHRKIPFTTCRDFPGSFRLLSTSFTNISLIDDLVNLHSILYSTTYSSGLSLSKSRSVQCALLFAIDQYNISSNHQSNTVAIWSMTEKCWLNKPQILFRFHADVYSLVRFYWSFLVDW